MQLIIKRIEDVTPNIRHFFLESKNAEDLPAYTSGANISIAIEDGQGIERREYSLIGDGSNPTQYEIAVLKVPQGRGSSWLHSLPVEHEITVAPPRNAFSLAATAEKHILIAGGIGITPILSMARTLHKSQQHFEVFYTGKSLATMAFLDEIKAFGLLSHIYSSDTISLRPYLKEIISASNVNTHIYVCGPDALITDVVSYAKECQLPQQCIHFELFGGALSLSGDKTFKLVLDQSGMTLDIPPEKTMLEVLNEAGIEPLYDCKRGECGMCFVSLLEGEGDHRDSYQSQADKDANHSICLCVSRARSEKIVIDL